MDMLGHKLSVILVGRHHEGLEARTLGAHSESADDIVRFVAVQFNHGNIECADQSFDVGNGDRQVFGHLITVCFVVFKGFVAMGGCRGIEHHSDVAGFLLAQNFEQSVREAEHGRCIQPFGVDAVVCGKGEVGSENQGHGIQQKQFFRISVHAPNLE